MYMEAASITGMALLLAITTLLAMLAKGSRSKTKKLIRQLGEGQGLLVLENLERDGFKFDLAWKRGVDEKPTHVFILKKLRPFEALAALKHAYDLWRARGFYITDKQGVEEVSRLLKGSFHEVNGFVWALTKEDVKEVVRLKAKYGELLEKLKPVSEQGLTVRPQPGGWGAFDWLPPIKGGR